MTSMLVVGHKNPLFKQAARIALKHKLHSETDVSCLYWELKEILLSDVNAEHFLHRYIVLAYHGFKPVGIFYITSNGLLIDSLFEIQLFVKPEFRKKGIAKAMLKAVLAKTNIKTSRMYNRGAFDAEANIFFHKNDITVTYGSSILQNVGKKELFNTKTTNDEKAEIVLERFKAYIEKEIEVIPSGESLNA